MPLASGVEQIDWETFSPARKKAICKEGDAEEDGDRRKGPARPTQARHDLSFRPADSPFGGGEATNPKYTKPREQPG
jgi:hypothetical protein